MKNDPPVIRLPTPSSRQSENSDTPLGELLDRKDLDGLHSSTVLNEDGKPRRRSITEGTASG